MALVLVVAAGAGWEAPALARLDHAPGIVVLKRCVDIDDLLAMATLDQADAAVLGADAPGLDARAVEVLREHGVRPVVVVPSGPASELVRQRAVRSGATRLVADDDLDALPAAILDAQDPVLVALPVVEAPRGEGRVTAVWGPAGAPGRTTVAAGLAAVWAEADGPTMLVDADPYGGAVAQQLGILDDVSGLLRASRAAASGDLESRLATCIRMVTPGLGVLTGLPRPDRWVELRAGALAQIVAAGRRRGHVVVDTGFSIEIELDGRPSRNQLTLDALEEADDVVVVGSADPVGLSRLAQGLGELRDRGLTERATVVVNRMRPSLGWRSHEVVGLLQEAGGRLPVHFVPDDAPAVDRAIVTGRTLLEVGAGAPVARAISSVADAVAHTEI